MRIIATSLFLDGRYEFADGGKYDVPDRRGGVYLAYGWAREGAADDPDAYTPVSLDQLTADAPLPAVDGTTLTVQDVGIGHLSDTPGA